MEFILKAWLYLAFMLAGAMAMYLWQKRAELSNFDFFRHG